MSGACCGGASKAETTKVVGKSVPQTTEVATEPSTPKSSKSECCNDSPANGEKHSCGC